MKPLGRLLLLALLLPWAAAAPARADEFRPAYLQLKQVDAATYDVLWKLPALDEATTLRLRPEFPPGTRAVTPIRSVYAAGTAVQRWRIAIEGGLDGKAVAFAGVPGARVDVLVRLERADGSEQLGRVPPVGGLVAFAASPTAFDVAWTYAALGVQHILLGVDHLLFVLALLILVRGAGRLVATITAFTVAHSVTLAAATLGWVDVPGPPVEAAIALSIVFVAVEIVRGDGGRPGLAERSPWVVAFAFGLLHGLGFAGALAEVGLPRNSIPLALLFFNVGVEIGQLVFVLAVLGVVAAGRRIAGPLGLARGTGGRAVAAYLVGGLASFWFVERLAAF